MDARPDDAHTVLLKRWTTGENSALEQLVPMVYAELRGIARRELYRGPQAATLQPTALVNDVLLHLMGREQALEFQSRGHFFNLSAKIMRQLLLMRARARGADKRGGDWRRMDFDQALAVAAIDDPASMEIEDALTRLEAIHPRMAQVVELRYFMGLTVDEVAEALEIDKRTVYREWATARAWLATELSDGSFAPDSA